MNQGDELTTIHLDQYDLQAILDAITIYHTFLARATNLRTLSASGKHGLARTSTQLRRIHSSLQTILTIENNKEDQP